MNIEARPWRPQDLLDDLQQIIDEEPDRYLNTRRATLCMALDYLKEHFAQREDGWISVEHQLPEPGKEVLLLAHGWEGRLHYVGKLDPSPAQEGFFGTSKASEWTIWGWSYFREPRVTHWMPLPEPPEIDNLGVCGCTSKPCSECQPGPCEHRRQEVN